MKPYFRDIFMTQRTKGAEIERINIVSNDLMYLDSLGVLKTCHHSCSMLKHRQIQTLLLGLVLTTNIPESMVRAVSTSFFRYNHIHEKSQILCPVPQDIVL